MNFDISHPRKVCNRFIGAYCDPGLLPRKHQEINTM